MGESSRNPKEKILMFGGVNMQLDEIINKHKQDLNATDMVI